jgi:hypothetical protein
MTQLGGTILPNNVLTKIVSIGYEFESPDLSPIEFNTQDQRWFPSRGRIPLTETNERFQHVEAYLMTDTASLNETTRLTQLDNYYHQVRDNLIVYARAHDPNPMRFSAPENMLPEAQYFCDTEFHFTYRHFDPSPTIIKDTLSHAIGELHTLFSTSALHLAYYGQGTLIRLVTLNSPDWLRFIVTDEISNVYNDLFFYTQMTIGVSLENIMEVISYISEDTADHRYLEYLVGMVNTIRNMTKHTSSQLSGWLFLLLLNMLPKDIYSKYDYSYSLRHPLGTIFAGLSPEDQTTGNQIVQLLRETYGDIHTHNQYQNLRGLITNIIDRNIDPLEKTWTKQYPYENKTILLEIRSFPIILSKLFKNPHMGLTLSNLSDITQKFM